MDNSKSANENGDSNKTKYSKFELLDCHQNCKNCKTVLAEINRLYAESEQYQLDKEYQFSILALERAFNKTTELVEPSEQKCTQLFRLTIVESLENIHRELKKMTAGFFRKNRYKASYQLAEKTLNDLKKKLPAGKQRDITPAPAKKMKSGISAG